MHEITLNLDLIGPKILYSDPNSMYRYLDPQHCLPQWPTFLVTIYVKTWDAIEIRVDSGTSRFGTELYEYERKFTKFDLLSRSTVSYLL